MFLQLQFLDFVVQSYDFMEIFVQLLSFNIISILLGLFELTF